MRLWNIESKVLQELVDREKRPTEKRSPSPSEDETLGRASYFWKQAFVYFCGKHYSQAEYELDRLITEVPDFIEAYWQMARVKWCLNQFEDVEKYLKKAAQMENGTSKTDIFRVAHLIFTGLFHEAWELLRKKIDLDGHFLSFETKAIQALQKNPAPSSPEFLKAHGDLAIFFYFAGEFGARRAQWGPHLYLIPWRGDKSPEFLERLDSWENLAMIMGRQPEKKDDLERKLLQEAWKIAQDYPYGYSPKNCEVFSMIPHEDYFRSKVAHTFLETLRADLPPVGKMVWAMVLFLGIRMSFEEISFLLKYDPRRGISILIESCRRKSGHSG